MLSSNQRKANELAQAARISISGSLELPTPLTIHNIGVPLAKICEGMTVPDEQLQQMYELLTTALADQKPVPGRVLSLIGRIASNPTTEMTTQQQTLLVAITDLLPILREKH